MKLFTPDRAATRVLTEFDGDGDTAFGLFDLGIGCPELGCVNLAEIQSVGGKLGLPVERDLYFKPDKTIAVYAAEARRLGYIQS